MTRSGFESGGGGGGGGGGGAINRTHPGQLYSFKRLPFCFRLILNSAVTN